jgi:hypothetical protein
MYTLLWAIKLLLLLLTPHLPRLITSKRIQNI